MTIQLNTAKNTLCTEYKLLGDHLGMATADPGNTTTPTPGAEPAVNAGSSGYERQAIAWGTPAAGVMTAPAVTVPVPAGTFTYAMVCEDTLTAVGPQVDNCLITSVTLAANGQIVVTPTFTQS